MPSAATGIPRSTIVDDAEQFHDTSQVEFDHENHFDQVGKCQHQAVATHHIIPEEDFFDSMAFID
jgi:hypothetical protein